jgi:hypothetical protein
MACFGRKPETFTPQWTRCAQKNRETFLVIQLRAKISTVRVYYLSLRGGTRKFHSPRESFARVNNIEKSMSSKG